MAKLGGIVRVKWVDVDCATPNSHWPSHDFGSSHVGVLTIETQMAQIRNSSGFGNRGKLSAGSLVFELVEKFTCPFKKIIYVAEIENTYYCSADAKAGRY